MNQQDPEAAEVSFLQDEEFAENGQGFEGDLVHIAKAAAAFEGISLQVNVLLTGERRIQDLNREFRGMDSVTDVLSFPACDFEGHMKEWAEVHDVERTSNGSVVLGDIAVCVPRAEEQARSIGHSVRREIMFLVLHGVLHLLGYDHIDPADEEEMTALQRQIIAQIPEENAT